ncbi:S8 family peptidase [Terrabacter terrigena]|uniref:S8 family serine peptidase n=1 Tax=Terrabacter terrigena TaxID=574718 RepID=A0ABW3N145_9MICO
MAQRSDVQVDKILDAVGRDNVDVHRGPDGTVDYIRRRRLLTDVDAVEDVYGHLKRTPPPQSQRRSTRLEKLHRFDVDLEPDQTLDDLLDDLDRNVGEGTVTADYLLHVCTTWCGATEPQPTTATEPLDRNTDRAATGKDVRVSVVDTGRLLRVVRAHPWLDGVRGDDEPANIGHYAGHGTFVAGVVRAYAPEADVKVESVTTMGGTVFESDMVDQLIEAVSFDPHVISFSGGTRTRGDRPLKSFEMFYEQYLKDRGDETVFVCAAGNDGDEGLFWPAAFDWAVGVGALDEDHESLAGYSNRGEWVDVYALGTDVVNAYPNGTYTYQEPPDSSLPPATFTNGMASWSGTSFAAPMVAGLIAARLSWNGADARTSWNQVKALAVADAGAGLDARLRDARAASRP